MYTERSSFTGVRYGVNVHQSNYSVGKMSKNVSFQSKCLHLKQRTKKIPSLFWMQMRPFFDNFQIIWPIITCAFSKELWTLKSRQFQVKHPPVKTRVPFEMNPRDITLSDLQSLRHLAGACELMEAMRTNKSQEEIKRIILRHPRLMATLIIYKGNYYGNH